MNNLKIFLISQDSLLAGQVAEKVSQAGFELFCIGKTISDIYEFLASDDQALILWDRPSNGYLSGNENCQIDKINHKCMHILLLAEIDRFVVKRAFKSGALDVLKIPEEMDNLPQVIKNAYVELNKKTEGGEKSDGTRQGKLVAIYSAKGGAGKTFIAVHLAQALSIKTSKKILLVDLNLQFGGVQNYLDIDKPRSFMDLMPVIDELDAESFNNVVCPEGLFGFKTLLGPANPELSDTVNDEHITAILTAARENYDIVLVDTPAELNLVSLSALNIADNICYIVTPDSPALFAMKSALEFFEKYGFTSKVSLIINRMGSNNDINANDIKLLAELPVWAQVRSDFNALQTFVNLGRPLYTNGKDKGSTKIARDLLKLSLLFE